MRHVFTVSVLLGALGCAPNTSPQAISPSDSAEQQVGELLVEGEGGVGVEDGHLRRLPAWGRVVKTTYQVLSETPSSSSGSSSSVGSSAATTQFLPWALARSSSYGPRVTEFTGPSASASSRRASRR